MSFPFLIAVLSFVILGSYTIYLLYRKSKSDTHSRELTTALDQLRCLSQSREDGLCILTPEKKICFSNPTALSLLEVKTHSPTLSTLLESIPNPYAIAEAIDDCIKYQCSYIEKNIKLSNQTISIEVSPLLLEQKGTTPKVLGIALQVKDMALERSVSQMKEDFTNIISHELRSPLTTIRAASQFVRSQGEKLSTVEQHKLLTMIDDQSQKLLTEIELILDAAKLEIGEFIMHKTDGDIASLLEERIAFFLPQAEAKHITLENTIDSSIPQVAFDSRYLTLAMTNMLTNSLKFTPLGGKISVSAIKDTSSVVITVSDTGIGIPYEKQKEVFSKFSHISSPSAKVGTGIGLYIVKGIVEAHGGTIRLESEEGKGTTISFTIPLLLEKTVPTAVHQSLFRSNSSQLSN